jgi:thioredoxin 1
MQIDSNSGQEEILVMKKSYVIIMLGLVTALLTIGSTSASADPKINLQALLAKRVPVMLEFGRGWCIPCKYMKPILEDMGAAYQGKAIVMTVDMDANKDLVANFRVRMMPTQVFLTPDGKEFFRNEGTLERNQIAYVFSKMGLPEINPARPAQAPPADGPQTIPATQGAPQGVPR